MKQITTLVIALCFTSIGYSQNVGIGNTTPHTKLEVTGAISSTPVSAPASAAVVIPANVSIFRLTAVAGTQANALSMASPQEGQYLTIYNEDNDTATFAGQTIAASGGLKAFQYINAGWRLVSDNQAGGSNYIQNQTGSVQTGGYNISGNGYIGGNAGIGTPTPVNKLDVNGAAAIGNYAGTAPAPANGLIVSGNVGVGTNSPANKLEVAGNTKTANFEMTSGASSGYILKSDASGNATWVNPTSITTGTTVSNTSSANTLSTTVNGVTGATVPVINSISNTSSANTLSTMVNGVAGATVPIINTNVLSLAGSSVTSTINGVASNTLNIATAANNIYNTDGTLTGNRTMTMAADNLTLSSTTGNLIFNPSSTGKVGLGLISPQNMLDVNGSMAVGTFAGTSAPANSLLVSGMVGVGVARPANLLEVGADTSTSNLMMDQSNTSNNNSVGTYFFGQSFTAGATGALVSISVLTNGSSGSPAGTFNVYSGNGFGTLVSTSSFSFGSANGGWINFVLPTPIAVAAGQQYTWLLSCSPDMLLPFSTIDVYPGGEAYSAYGSLTQDFCFQTFLEGPSDYMVVTNSGNVGVGTNGPTNKLEVAGNTKTTNFEMTSGASSGYILKSDASGNATWVNPTSITTGTTVSNTSSANTLRTTVNGVAGATVPIINTISNTSSANTLSTTVNGVAGSTVPIVNTINNTSSANTLSTTVNGVAGSTVPIINTNVLSLAGSSVTATINGVASNALNIAAAANNIYNTDGTLTGARTVTIGTNNLAFSGTGNIGIGTTSPLGNLDVEATTNSTWGHLVINRSNAGAVGGQMSINNNGGGVGASAVLAFGTDGTTNFDGSGNNLANAEIRAVNTSASNATDLRFSNWSGSAENVNMVVTGAGNVGIGTTNSSATYPATANRLYVQGPTQTTNLSAAALKVEQYYVDMGGSNLWGPSLMFNTDNNVANSTWNCGAISGVIGTPGVTGNYPGGLAFSTKGADGTTTGLPVEQMRITYTGNVGVGTPSPLTKLDVNGSLFVRGANTNTPAPPISGLELFTGRNNAGGLISGQTSADVAFQYGGPSGGYRHFIQTRHNSSLSAGGNDIDFYLNNSGSSGGSSVPGTGNIQVMTLESNNGQPRVGIGNTSPASTLHIGNSTSSINTYLTLDAAAAEQSAIQFNSAGAQSWVMYRPGSSSDLRFYGNSADRVTFQAGGNVGIGTNAPNDKLEVSGNIRFTNGGFLYAPTVGGGSSGAAVTIQAGSTVYNGGCGSGGNLNLIAGNMNSDGSNCAGSGNVILRAGANQYQSTANGNLYFFAGQTSTGQPESNIERMRIVGDNGTMLLYNELYVNNNGTSTGSGSSGAVQIGDGTISKAYGGNFLFNSNITFTSDQRIKNIVGYTDQAKDLETLNNIRITDYTLRDDGKTEKTAYKKVIAQQVQSVYPQAVQKNGIPQYIPDIYQNAKSYIVTGNTVTIYLNDEICENKDLKVGGNCKFYIYAKANSAEQEVKGTVTAIYNKCLVIHTDESIDAAEYDSRLFVYGTEIHDLLSVDYEAISMLNVSATQELARQLKDAQSQISVLKTENEKANTTNSKLQSDIDKLKASVETLQDITGAKVQR